MAGIPSLYRFKKRLLGMQEGNFDILSPSDVWKVSNETSSDAFYGGRLKVEQVRKIKFFSCLLTSLLGYIRRGFDDFKNWGSFLNLGPSR
jgi:hypothetical protein